MLSWIRIWPKSSYNKKILFIFSKLFLFLILLSYIFILLFIRGKREYGNRKGKKKPKADQKKMWDKIFESGIKMWDKSRIRIWGKRNGG